MTTATRELIPQPTVTTELAASAADFPTRDIDFEPIPTHCFHGVARIAGAKVEYTLEVPVELTDPTPLLLVAGYMGIKSAYREVRHHTAAQGKPAISYRKPRAQAAAAALHPRHLSDGSRLGSQAAYGVLRAVQASAGYEQFDAAGHSEGGFILSNVASRHPQLFDTTLFVGSAGLDGHDLIDMAQRLPSVFSEELIPALPAMSRSNDPRVALELLHYIMRSPARTIREGLAVGSCDIRDKVQKLGQLGIHTGALLFADDHFFPLEGVQRESSGVFDTMRVFDDPRANHIWPQLQPAAVATAQLDLLHDLKRN